MACRATAEKRQLLRFVRGADGLVAYDAGGRCPGRGAYLCDALPCFDQAQKKHLLDRALKVRLDASDYQRLREACAAMLREAEEV